MRRPLALAGLGLLVLSACSQPTTITADPQASAYGTISISTGLSKETRLVAYLYAEALRQAGYSTTLVESTDRADYLNQLSSGVLPTPGATLSASNDPATLDIVPDFSGELLLHLTEDGRYSVAIMEQRAAATSSSTETSSPAASVTPSPQATSLNIGGLNQEDIKSSLKRLLPDGISLLEGSSADPRYTLAMTRAASAPHKYTGIGDLAPACPQLTFTLATGSTESISRALTSNYTCAPASVKASDTPEKNLEALLTDQAQVAQIRVTEPAISQNDLLTLSDPSNIFINQHITPIIRESEVPAGARNAINAVSSRLNNSDLTKLLKLTQGHDALSYEDAAKFWLDSTQE